VSTQKRDLKQSGIANDIASPSYNISVDPMAPVDLVCGSYRPVHEVGAGEDGME